jgi:hypothetical protein
MESGPNRKDFKPFGVCKKKFPFKNGLQVDFIKTQGFICNITRAVVIGL